jgi:hypothetical protein
MTTFQPGQAASKKPNQGEATSQAYPESGNGSKALKNNPGVL